MMRVLIVEDEALVSMMLEDYLEDLGHDVANTVPTVNAAIQCIDEGNVDCAILDVNLSGETAYPVADHLLSLGIPFAFATGYGLFGVDEAYKHVPVLHKPFDERRLSVVLADLSGDGDLKSQMN